MFLMIAAYNKQKEIPYSGGMEICPACGRYCSCGIFVEYMCLSIFFIPVLKWGKRYYVETSCCGKTYELTKEQGRKAENGEKIAVN